MRDSIAMNSDVGEKIDEQPPRSVADSLDENMETLIVASSEKDAGSMISSPPPDVEIAEGSTISFDHKSGVQGGVSFSNNERDDSFLSKGEIDGIYLSGVKRPRLTVSEKQPSVHVIYNSLPRESIKMLGELLQQWSQWHSQKYPSSDEASSMLESGEETHYPALRVGMDKPCAVTFWVDETVKTHISNDIIPLDGASVPLYDRGYSSALTSADGLGISEGGLQNLDRFRCFNCGSYSHSLKDCHRPRDNMAVNNARKMHKSKRNQNRNSTRYYQSSHKGKYDGLRPGTLDAETKKAMGLGNLDPPPWLNRMREIGYPPGYLDEDEEDQPSGITIFGDEKIDKVETVEEGEILDQTTPKLSKKMIVEFPGINAPIPEDADLRLWALSPSVESSNSRNNEANDSSHFRRNYSSEQRLRLESGYDSRSSTGSFHRRHYSDRSLHRDMDEELPPGCDPGMSPSLSTRYSRWGE